MIPATLLRGLGPDLVHGAPDGQAAIGQHQARRRQAAVPKIAQHGSPRLGRLAVTGPHRQDLLAAVAPGADDDQQGRLVLLQPGLHVDAVGPGVDQLPVVQTPLLPGLELLFPHRPQTGDGRGRQGRPVAQQASQSQLEVSLRQPMQVELGQQLGHLEGASLEQRQDAALKALLQTSNPRPSHLDGARHQRQPSRLAIAVARARGAVHRRPARIPRPPQHFGHLLLQHALQQVLDPRSGPGFQGHPGGHGRGGMSCVGFFTATLSFQARRHPGRSWCAAK